MAPQVYGASMPNFLSSVIIQSEFWQVREIFANGEAGEILISTNTC